ncbi:MAG: sigma 54-interacting transcriptional regulator [Acidobacteriota bacterium]
MAQTYGNDHRYPDKVDKHEILLDPNTELFPLATADINVEKLIESYNRLQLIYSLGRTICQERELNRVLEVVMAALIRLIDLERCFIAIFDKSGQLQATATHNITLPNDPTQWPVSTTMIVRVLENGVSILSSDATKDDAFANFLSVGMHNIRSVMCVPLGPRGSCIGLIYVDNRRRSNSFPESDLLFLTALGHYIYFSVRNASEIAQATAERQLSDERWVVLQEELLRDHQIVGHSEKLLSVYRRLRQVANKNLPILLMGETGTGKELFAKAAHKLNQRRAKKFFMALNIAVLSETLVESELFGHEKGAFSGATAMKVGKLELANGGTLFLDEVTEIPLNIQAKLLRVLETGDFERVGGTKQLHTDVRLVCAANKDLEEVVKRGLFREDLYYRLKGVTIQLPPLRERIVDIPYLIQHILAKLDSDKIFTDAAIKLMQDYNWPGNIRQLIRLVEEIDAVCESQQVKAADLPAYLHAAQPSTHTPFLPLNDLIAQVECEHIRRALTLSGGNNERAIKLLGISRAKFFERKKACQL